jgi:hypothetical protein
MTAVKKAPAEEINHERTRIEEEVGWFVEHFIPIYSLWLNLIERRFGEIKEIRLNQNMYRYPNVYRKNKI